MRQFLVHLAYRYSRRASLLRRAVASLRQRGLVASCRVAWQRWKPVRATSVAGLVLVTDVPDPDHLQFPQESSPRASIIIPVHNQLDFTLRCLQSLLLSGDASRYEVIVVDDASSDLTSGVLPGIAGLRYLRMPDNLGFIGACNAGAKMARGQYLVFLNNDTLAQPGWLDALLSTFASYPDTGLAGSKLVYPDGRLQEAGGVVFSDASASNYGRYADPSDPRFNFVREADYCSGAAIALAREVFEDLAGFDTYYAPAYYEDTDLAMRVRELGLVVRYQPASMVVHCEGVSAGTDLGRGMKAYQKSNREKFLSRWRDELASGHAPPVLATDPEAAILARARARVLVIDANTPTPDRDSGSLRIVRLMRLLREEACHVAFFNLLLRDDGAYSRALEQLGVEVWSQPWISTVPAWLREHGRRFDAIVVSRHYVLEPLLPLLREYAPQARIVFDTVDLHFLREEREAAQAGRPASMRTRSTELGLIQSSDLTWVVSPEERSLLGELAPRAEVSVVSNIHDPVYGTPGREHRRDLVFVGGFRHPPNVDAVRWLLQDIFPRIRQRRPDLQLHLVGAEPPTEIQSLAEDQNVVLHGHLPGLDGLLDETRIALAPLRYGAGVKGKVNHALARGLPVVATSCAVEGMRLVPGESVLIADDAQTFADAVIRLNDDPRLWQQLREGGLENTREHFSEDAARIALRAFLEGLGPR
jgi:GT2 family glycosyltransferase